MTPAEILALLNVFGQVAMHSIDAYEKMHEIAVAAGVDPTEVAKADIRFAKVYTDPLAKVPPVAGSPV